MWICLPARAGTWVAITRAAPASVDTVLLLSDGTVMAANAGRSAWYRLTPDSRGSYINGTWSTLAAMHDTRLYYSSAVLRDGRVFVAGGEYGSGKSTAEVYNPLNNTWTYTPPSFQSFSDSVSKILPNGNVLVAPVGPSPSGRTIMYDPVANAWVAGGKLFRGSYQDEASWVKLPDDSILTIDPFGANSERYIPSSNSWVNDAAVPVTLYDPYGSELGPAFLLADGRAFFLGSDGHTAFYTPSGTTAPGTWAQGPDFPNGQGMPDAPAAMMVNGKILCVTSAKPTSANHFPTPASFYEYDPVANSFASVSVPGPLTNLQQYVTRMLDLPDGTVLFSHSSSQLFVYQPDGSAFAAGKPAITSINFNPDGSFHLTGTLLNGISEGAAYGDDAQMNSNYPLIRLTNSNGNVYYARTYNWSSTSVMTGTRPLTTEFVVPSSQVAGAFTLVVSANGNASDPLPFTTTIWTGVVNGDWDTNTANWLKSSVASNYNQADFVIFDDSVSGASNVTVTMTLTPGGLLFKNARTNYFLSGSGAIGGSGGVILSGAANVTLAETGGDTFSGGIIVNSGTLMLDTANGAASGGMSIGPGASVFVGMNDSNGSLPAGTVTNNGAIIFNQTSDVLLANAVSGNGSLTKNNTNTLTLTGVNTWTGSTLISAGTVALSGSGAIAGSTNINIAAGASVAASNRVDGTLTLSAGQNLQGNGSVAGSLAGLPASGVMPGASAAIGTLKVYSNVSLQGVITMKIAPLLGANDLLYASTISYGGVLNISNLSAQSLTVGASFPLFMASNYSGAFSAIYPVIPAPGLAWNTNNLTVDGSISVTYQPGDTWTGGVHGNGNWDTNIINWSNSGLPTNYNQGDMVTFDDSVIGTSSVILALPLTPGQVSFDNSSSNYFFSGSGSLLLTNGLTKNLAGTVTLAETGGDSISGGVAVNGGTLILDTLNSAIAGNANVAAGATLELGLNDTNGALPSGTLLLNGRLILNRTNNFTISNPIAGSGSLNKSNTDLIKISHNNSAWTGEVNVAQGTLQIGAVNALGSGTNVLITINNGATLDINGISGTNAVVASGSGAAGNGAIVNNSGVAASPALARLTLSGNTTIGGVGRWDLRPAGGSADTAGDAYASLSTGSQPYSLTKTGANFIGIVSANVDPALANVYVQAGTLDLEGDLPGLGNPASNIVVSSGATLEFYNLGAALSKAVLLNDGASILNSSGGNTLNKSLVLSTNSSGGPGSCAFNIGGSFLAINAGVISGPGNLIKSGTATLRLYGANTYRGSTAINAGTLALYTSGSILSSSNIYIASGATLRATDRTDFTFALTNGQTLQGNGTLTGMLTARAGSTLTAGPNFTTIGTLTVSSNVTLQGSTIMKVDTISGANDALTGSTMTYGGTLTVSNISPRALAAGNSFRFFKATHYAGSFSAINPAKPGLGLQWNKSNLNVNGSLAVAALPQPGIVSFSFAGANLVINATNGVAGSTYSVLMSTNIGLPLAQWMPISTSVLNANGNFTITASNSVAPTAPQQFYMLRAQ